MPNGLFKKITLHLTVGVIFFMVIIMNSTKANINISYSIAHPPPFVDSNSKEQLLCKWSYGWHNRPAFTLFLVSPLTSDCSDKIYYTPFIRKIQDILTKRLFSRVLCVVFLISKSPLLICKKRTFNISTLPISKQDFLHFPLLSHSYYVKCKIYFFLVKAVLICQSRAAAV